MTPPKIIIEIRNGTLAAVYANQTVLYVLVDRDNISQGEGIDLNVMEPDLVGDDMHTFFGTSEAGIEISKQLKELNF
jgi:hypothetical protein